MHVEQTIELRFGDICQRIEETMACVVDQATQRVGIPSVSQGQYDRLAKHLEAANIRHVQLERDSLSTSSLDAFNNRCGSLGISVICQDDPHAALSNVLGRTGTDSTAATGNDDYAHLMFLFVLCMPSQ
ncbi:hypothetical protein D3C86_1629060 [compost metagenome]